MNMPVYSDALNASARRSTSHPPGRGASNPLLYASQEALRFLLVLTFGRRALGDLSQLAGCDADASATEVWTVADELAAAARVDRVVGRLVDDALAVRLKHAAAPYIGRPVCALATLWARQRATLSGPGAAALLWVVARSTLPCTRQFEATLLDGLRWRAVRGLGAR